MLLSSGMNCKTETSIVITTFGRANLLEKTLVSIRSQRYKNYEIIVVEDGNDGGMVMAMCSIYGAKHYQRRNRPSVNFANPAQVVNIGVKRAQGDILILQHGECLHDGPDVIERLVAPHRTHPAMVQFASVMDTDEDGKPTSWLCHEMAHRPYYFCASIRRDIFMRQGGMEEGFRGYGFEDDWFSLCLKVSGVELRYSRDIYVRHQWHPPITNRLAHKQNYIYYYQLIQKLKAGKMSPVANQGREWGVLEKTP